jgi:radical SAM superfamily enzyme YgiQ (UPF0313 family)
MQLDKQVKVGLVQIGDKFGNQYYLPYSIGLLQAYAQKKLKNPEEFVFLLAIYKKIKIDKSIDYLLEADIVFFSTYIWNHKISLEIAKGIKQRKDDCIIVFGGPQVPESADEMKIFLRNYPFIDIGCYGEGEIPFLSILENAKERSWKNVPSIGFTTKDNNFMYNPVSERIKNLNEIPSPYLEGIFDSLIEANPQEEWSALIETNRGCPHTCAFCYWGKKTRNKVYQYEMERVFKEIDWISQQKIEFVFCCDANFGLLKRDVDIVLKVTENKKRYDYPKAFSIQNTKNSTEKIFMIQKILNDSGLQKGVNLALQSLNENTLKSISRRNITNKIYRDLQQMFTQNKIPTFSDLIIGLPNENYDTFTDGVSELIESGQHNRIQFINLTILENTEMSKPKYQKEYGLLIKELKAIPHHTIVDSELEVYETQNLVIGTATMLKEEWVKTRAFCWIMSLFYFNKLLQIPFILMNKICSVSYRELTEIFMVRSDRYSKISEILTFFITKAKEIQNGGCEHVASKEWLNIWWPADEYMFIKICVEGHLAAFYEEAELTISDFLKEKKINFYSKLLHDAVRLNKSLIKLPFIETDMDISLDYNIFEIYQGVLNGLDVPLKTGDFNYTIDRTSQKWATWDEWFREVVWYGTKKGAYLYDCKNVNY